MSDQFLLSYRPGDVQERLSVLIQTLDSPQEILEEIGETLLSATQDRWDAEIDPKGQPWKPLAPSTIRYKQSKGLSPKILQATQRLKKSPRYIINGKELRLVSDVPYAPFVQADREFLGISDDDLEKITEIISRRINL